MYMLCLLFLFHFFKILVVGSMVNDTITELLSWEGTSGSHLVKPLCSAWSQLPRTMSGRLLNVSKDEDFTTSLHNLCQSLVTLRVKKYFLMFRRNLLCFSLFQLPLVLSLGTTAESLAPAPLHCPLMDETVPSLEAKSFCPCPVALNTKPKQARFTNQNVAHQSTTKLYQEKPEADFHHAARRFWCDFFYPM